jgi:hypothetical protein
MGLTWSKTLPLRAECSSLRSSACAHTSGCFWPNPRVGPETGRAPADHPRPYLLRHYLAAAGVALIGRDHRSDVAFGSEFEVRTLAGQDWPNPGPVTNSLNFGPEASDVYLLGLLLVDRASSVSTITAWTRRPREYWLQ